MRRHEVQEIQLRDEGDELAAGRQPGEIGEPDAFAADLALGVLHLLMGESQKGIEQPELGQDIHRRGVNGIAAEVAQEIGMLLQHHHVDTGAREQIAGDQSGGSSAGDHARGCLGQHCHGYVDGVLADGATASPRYIAKRRRMVTSSHGKLWQPFAFVT